MSDYDANGMDFSVHTRDMTPDQFAVWAYETSDTMSDLEHLEEFAKWTDADYKGDCS